MISIIVFLLIVSLIGTVQPTHAQKETIVTNAKKQIGVPYRLGGTTPSGFDCSGFIRYVFNQSNITLPRTAAEQYRAGTAVRKADLEVGDLVFFQTVSRGPSHSGIYVGDNNFIHASSSRGITISSINDPHYWGPRYLGARRVLEEETKEVAVAVAQPTVVALGPGQFRDVPQNHWAYIDIKALSIEGIINGFGNGIFQPNGEVTRAQAAILLAGAKGMNTTNKETSFSDVPSTHWAAEAIAATTEAGIFHLTSAGKFEPNKPMTRDEVAVLFARAYSLETQGNATQFNDVASTHWAAEEIRAVTFHNLFTGFPDNTYRPSEAVTRAQFAKVLHTAIRQ